MELAPNTYYMLGLKVAGRASGKALAGEENVRLCSTPAQGGAIVGERTTGGWKKTRSDCARSKFGLDHGFMKVSCAAAADLQHTGRSMLILETRKEP
jgi:hypothetical protein